MIGRGRYWHIHRDRKTGRQKESSWVAKLVKASVLSSFSLLLWRSWVRIPTRALFIEYHPSWMSFEWDVKLVVPCTQCLCWGRLKTPHLGTESTKLWTHSLIISSLRLPLAAGHISWLSFRSVASRHYKDNTKTNTNNKELHQTGCQDWHYCCDW